MEDIRAKNLTKEEIEELDRFSLEMIKKYVEAEHIFLDLVFELSDQEGMTKQEAKDYITYLGRLRMYQLGLEGEGVVGENPLPWMDYILTGSKHTNFFESRVTEYSHTGLQGNANYAAYKELMDSRQ